MRLLLDTCTFLWLTEDAPSLSAAARAAFADPDNEIFLSAVSAWEISLKHQLGKLPLPDPPHVFVPQQRELHGVAPLPLGEPAPLQLSRLPQHHRDPFDRLLICQAIAEGLVLLTPDSEIQRYPVRTLW